MSVKKIVAVMPIKLNNERLQNKNILSLGGKPLIRWQLDLINQMDSISSKYVFCSDESIKKYLPNGIQFLKRDALLDANDKNFNDIFSSFISIVDADIYLYIHATAPFVTEETIEDMLNHVISDNYDSAFCATKIQDFLWCNNSPLNFNPERLPRSQDLDVIWRETSGVYVIKKKMYKKLHRRVGEHPYIKEVCFKESIDINNPEDFELAKVFV